MKVTLAKHGGWQASLRRPPLVVDGASLTPEEADELARLVAAAKAVANAPDKRSASAPEAMKYIVTVEHDGEPILLRQTDTNLTPAFAALMTWIEHQSRKRAVR
jgi:hypothetical protein